MILGGYFWAADDPWATFKGAIDELRISRTVRYNGPFAPPLRHTVDDDTVVLFHLDEGSGSTLVNAAGEPFEVKLDGPVWVAEGKTAEPDLPRDSVPELKLVRMIEGHNSPRRILASLDSQTLYFTSSAGGIERMRLDDGTIDNPLPDLKISLADMRLFDSDRRVVIAGFDGRVEVWSLETGEQLRTLEPKGKPSWHLRLSPNERRVLYLPWGEGLVVVRELESGDEVCRLAGTFNFMQPAGFLNDSRRIVVAGGRGNRSTLQCWDCEQQQEVSSCQVQRTRERGQILPGDLTAFWTENGQCVLWSPVDNSVRYLAPRVGSEARRFTFIEGPVAENIFVSGGEAKGRLSIWNALTGEAVLASSASESGFGSACFTPDGLHLAGLTIDRTLRVWRIPQGLR